jgi:hypothetical protein
VRCQSGDKLPIDRQNSISAHATKMLDEARASNLDALWADLHPQARSPDNEATFREAIASLQVHLNQVQGGFRLTELHHVDVSGGTVKLARVYCPQTEASEPLSVFVNAGNEDLAIATFHGRGGAFDYTATVQLRARGDRWHLFGLSVNPSRYRGKDAVAFEQLGDRWAEQHNPLPAAFSWQLATLLSTRGGSVTSADHKRVSDKLATLQKDSAYQKVIGPWEVEGQTLVVTDLSLAPTQAEISGVVHYVSPGGLIPDVLALEADRLTGYIATRYPELSTLFSSLVFEAYDEIPQQAGQSYKGYRTVRPLAKPASDGT